MKKALRNIIAFVLCAVIICAELLIPAVPTRAEETTLPALTYGVHVQRMGDQKPVVSQGTKIGTAGTYKQGLRLESIQMSVSSSEQLHVQYRTHVQSVGWLPWVSDGEFSGTRGYSRRMEAIMIRLSGKAAKKYDVWYRVYAQRYGWLAWTKNGEAAGTAGKGMRLEMLQAVIAPKGQDHPAKASRYSTPFISDSEESATPSGSPKVPHVIYAGHAETYGNILPKTDGATLGVTGEGKRLEAFYVRLSNLSGIGSSGEVVYRAYVEGSGWQNGLKNGRIAGTMGQGRRLEALSMKLTGKIAKTYDIEFRVHMQRTGWTPWGKSGQIVGDPGKGRRIEALQVRLVEKNRNKALEQ